ncbi:hypothetical protein [Salisaeta longa]|uniref:hypothetical protein n=1 Tax=Salisaeta longa TaxID=503170 RepID=UPI000491086A|nr:hypothetical protein [Salisaeta longa]
MRTLLICFVVGLCLPPGAAAQRPAPAPPNAPAGVVALAPVVTDSAATLHAVTLSAERLAAAAQGATQAPAWARVLRGLRHVDLRVVPRAALDTAALARLTDALHRAGWKQLIRPNAASAHTALYALPGDSTAVRGLLLVARASNGTVTLANLAGALSPDALAALDIQQLASLPPRTP